MVALLTFSVILKSSLLQFSVKPCMYEERKETMVEKHLNYSDSYNSKLMSSWLSKYSPYLIKKPSNISYYETELPSSV